MNHHSCSVDGTTNFVPISFTRYMDFRSIESDVFQELEFIQHAHFFFDHVELNRLLDPRQVIRFFLGFSE